MRNPQFWETQIKDCVNSRHQVMRVALRDKFREIFSLRIDPTGKQTMKFEEDISKLRLSISSEPTKQNRIQIESKTDGRICEIVTNDPKKNETFFKLLKSFCAQNAAKTKEIQQMIMHLESGMVFLKYSKQSLSPHEKLFFYRYDDKLKRHLLISKVPSDPNPKNEKIASFSDIKTCTKKWEDGPGLKKFKREDPRIIDELVMVITLTSTKTIEILAKSQAQRDQFYNAIDIIRQQIAIV